MTTSAAVNVTVSATANIPPTITLTSPVNNSSYNQGDSMPFAATATDSDGTIVKVEFYDGSTLIYTATTAPYSIGVVASTIGSHTVTAVATDNNGATAISNAAQVTINAVVNTTPQAYYIHTDQLNTPRLITDNNNQAVWRWDNWEPFGNYITDEDPGNTGNKFTYNPRFAGQYYDAETGLSYNYFRDYNPQTGRYLQSDPIGLGGGQFSTYAYVDGDPLSGIDALGLAWQCKMVGLVLVCTNTADPGPLEPLGFPDSSSSSSMSNPLSGLIDKVKDMCTTDNRCEELNKVDTDTCNAITRRRGSVAGEACHASATQRYAACLRGKPLPPLNTWNN